MNFFLFATFTGSLLGALALLAAILLTDSAPAQAATAAIAIGLAVIPYCMMRVLHIAKRMEQDQERHTATMKLLTQIQDNTSKNQ